jgi:hypothetical protein
MIRIIETKENVASLKEMAQQAALEKDEVTRWEKIAQINASAKLLVGKQPIKKAGGSLAMLETSIKNKMDKDPLAHYGAQLNDIAAMREEVMLVLKSIA